MKSAMTTDPPVENTDRELWREREGDFYADSIFVTRAGGIGLNVGGHCIVKSLADWHRLATRSPEIVMGSPLQKLGAYIRSLTCR
jgi:hypothetical protein